MNTFISESEVVLVRDMAQDAITYDPNAIQSKQDALEKAALIGKVNNEADEVIAVDAQKALASLVRYCEKSRKEVKEPVLKLGRLIDKAAADFSDELQAELTRISTLVGNFKALQRAKQEAEERAAKLEAERIERERLANEERIRREAEEAQAKLDAEAAELARKANEAKSAEEAQAIELQRIELEKAKAQAQAKTLEQIDNAAEEASQKVAAVAPVARQQTKGQTVREDWEITVTDKWALARAHPMCVNIEPRLNDIKAILNGGGKVAGVLAVKKTTAGVRGA